METHAAVLCGIKDLRVLVRAIPEPSPDEVQVRIQSVGICGSDLAYWAKGVAGGFKKIDFSEHGLRTGYCGQMGHETSGTVTKVGANVTHLRLGDVVALEPGVPCAKCNLCRTGRYNLCKDMKFIGSAVNETPGAMCTTFNHAADFCYKLPEGMSTEEGAMLEPLCVALHAVRRAGVQMGSKILITGAGPIGLLTAMAARAAGATHITITDMFESKLKKAKEIGVDRTRKANDEGLAKELSQSVDIGFECSGASPALDLITSSTQSGGRICIVANLRESTPTRLQELARREIDVVGVYRYCNLYPTALSMVANGTVDLKPLISKSFALAQANEAFEYFSTGEPVKVIIKPSS